MPGSATDGIPAVYSRGPDEVSVIVADSAVVQSMMLQRGEIDKRVEAQVGGFCRHVISRPLPQTMAQERADEIAREFRGVPVGVTLARCVSVSP